MPKGVMITHSNLVSAVQGGLRVIGEVGPEDTYIAYLPLAHIFENVISFFFSIKFILRFVNLLYFPKELKLLMEHQEL